MRRRYGQLLLLGGCLGLWLFPAQASAPEGLVRLESPYSVEETADRFTAIVEERGLTLFNRIDHAAGAAAVDASLRPTQLIIFGNPAVGTPLMQCRQSVAIDLPQKALIWEDAAGQVWLGYNQPAYLQQRHQMQGCQALIERIAGVLNTLATAATEPDDSL